MMRVRACGLATLGLGAALLVLAPGACAQTPAPVPAVVAPPPLTPEQEAEVKRLFDEGKQAAGVQQWQKARDRFGAAYAIKQHWLIAALLGTAEVKTQRFRDAAEHLTFCLDNAPSDKLTGEERRELQGDFDRAAARVGTLRIHVDPPGAKVLVNGVEVRSPLPSVVFVDPGAVTVEARMEGFASDTKSVKAVAGKEEQVVLGVKKSSGAPPRTGSFPAPSPTGSFWNAQKVAGAALGSLGFAGVGMGAAFGVVAIRMKAESAKSCDPNNVCQDAGLRFRAQEATAGTASTILLAAGGAASIAGIVLLAVPTSTVKTVGLRLALTGMEVHGTW
jgi:hypothetical protein